MGSTKNNSAASQAARALGRLRWANVPAEERSELMSAIGSKIKPRSKQARERGRKAAETRKANKLAAERQAKRSPRKARRSA